MSAAAGDVRVQEARRWLASFPPDPELVTMTAGQLVTWAGRMQSAAHLLDAYVRDHEADAEAAEELEILAEEDARRLAAIRGVLNRFDWEHDDRQYALEAIERIADGGQQ